MNIQYPRIDTSVTSDVRWDMDQDLTAAIEKWRMTQNPPLTLAAATRELVRRALMAADLAGREGDSLTEAMMNAYREIRSR